MNRDEERILGAIRKGAHTTHEITKEVSTIRQVRVLRMLKSMEKYGMVRCEAIKIGNNGRGVFSWHIRE